MTRVLSAVARDAGIYVAAARGPVGPPRLEDDARVRAPMLAARRLEDAGEAAQDRAAGRSVGERPDQERGRELLVRVDGEHVRRRRDVEPSEGGVDSSLAPDAARDAKFLAPPTFHARSSAMRTTTTRPRGASGAKTSAAASRGEPSSTMRKSSFASSASS